MFNLLKEKLSAFVSGLSRKEETKEEPPACGKEPKEGPPIPAPPAQSPPAPPARVPVPVPERPASIHSPRAPIPAPPPVAPAARTPAPPALPVSLSLESRVRQAVLGETAIQEKDISGMLDDLELALLEADVAYDVAKAIVADLRSALVGMKVKRGRAKEGITQAVRGALLAQFQAGGAPDIVALAKGKAAAGEPLRILLLGPNGAGKTTTMAKLASLFGESGMTCVIAAADSFRAAAIEQAEAHGAKLGVHVVRHAYGADPAAVAFDAVNYARAHRVNVVLMDTAGRQETNRNLVEEMKKMARVAKPDLTIFVGESIAGNALVEQVKAFHAAVGLDGVILTKLDCDAKGGTALSVARGAGVPILFFGVGQGYGDLERFDAERLVAALLGA